MPRVNRDVQRRLEARRARERRRPAGTGPSYHFGPESAAPSEEETPAPEKAVIRRAVPASVPAGVGVRPGSYGDYGTQYSYVLADLRRIVLVVGGLLLALIVLYLLLPR